MFVEKASKTITQKPPDTSRAEESGSPRKVLYTSDEAIPPEVHFLKKNMYPCEQVAMVLKLSYLESSSPNFLGLDPTGEPLMWGAIRGGHALGNRGGCATIAPQQQPLESVSPPSRVGGIGSAVRPWPP